MVLRLGWLGNSGPVLALQRDHIASECAGMRYFFGTLAFGSAFATRDAVAHLVEFIVDSAASRGSSFRVTAYLSWNG